MTENIQKKKKDKKKNMLIMLAFSLLIALGISYAAYENITSGTKKYLVTAGYLQLLLDESKTDENILIENPRPITDEEGMKISSYRFSLKNDHIGAINYIIYLVEDEYENKTPTEAIRYSYTRDVGNIQAIRNMTDKKTEDGRFFLEADTIDPKTTYNYEFKMWLNYYAGNEVVDTEYSIHLELEAVNTVDSTPKDDPIPTTGAPNKEKIFANENLGENCKTYDDGENTFLVGQCARNYIWYSGKLWRVISKNNSTGAVKMITDNGITSIAYNPRNNTDFENSYVDQWLNQEFLYTLHDYQNYIVEDSIWNATLDSTSNPIVPSGTTMVTRPVGLLNAYEYFVTYNNSDKLATYATTYLNNGTNWWTATPYSTTYVRYINYGGSLTTVYPSSGYSVRPVVNLKGEIEIILGTGTQNDPYRLLGDVKKNENGITMISSKYIGEYVKFNNELYRIVDIENNLAKIIAVDRPNDLTTNKFHSASGMIEFGKSDIKGDLSNYYHSLNTDAKKMVETDKTWYLGQVADGTNYKASICDKVSNNTSTSNCVKISKTENSIVGLPRIGEMFTSQITRGTKATFWTLTPQSTSNIYYISNSGDSISGYTTNTYGVRPSLYLKQGVHLSLNNTGIGTYDNPYQLDWHEVRINNNSKYTTNATVELKLAGTNTYRMCVSNTSECTKYEAYSATKKWTLTSGDGEKTVYVYYKDKKGKIVGAASSKIILDTQAPTNNSIQVSSKDELYRNLTLASNGADLMCISNTSDKAEDCKDWMPYSNTYNGWRLSLGSGEKIVHAFFKDNAGNTAGPYTSKLSCTNCEYKYDIDAYNNSYVFLMREDGATAITNTASTTDITWYTENSQRMNACSAYINTSNPAIWCIGTDNNVYYKNTYNQTNWNKIETNAFDTEKYSYYIYAYSTSGMYIVRNDGRTNYMSTTAITDPNWSYGANKEMAVCSGYSSSRVVCLGKDGNYYYRTSYNSTTDYLGGTIFNLSNVTNKNAWIDMYSSSSTQIIESDDKNLYNAYFSYSASSTTWYTSAIPGNGIKACASAGNGSTNYCLTNDGYLYYKNYNATEWTKSNAKYK